MRKTLTMALAAATAAVGILGAGASASARDYYDRYGRRHHDKDHGDAIAAGIVGLALGAALASSNDGRRYDRGYYDRGYYGRGYYDRGYYGRGYSYGGPSYYGRSYSRTCSTVRTWDPYYGQTIYQRRCW